MSKTVHVNFAVTNTAIMNKTLDEMGIQHSEHGDSIIAKIKGYRDAEFNIKTSRITYDDMDVSRVNEVKQNYTVNLYKDQAIREGMQLTQERSANGVVTLRLTR